MWRYKGSHGYGHKNECVQCETGQYTQNAFFVLCFAAFFNDFLCKHGVFDSCAVPHFFLLS